jgi:hypothetical protein
MIAKSVKIIGAALAFASLAPVTSAFASGSIGGGANNGMKQGQSVYARKIACKSCKFPGGIKSQEQARSAISMIDNGQIAMTASEAKAAKDYIAKRFKGN